MDRRALNWISDGWVFPVGKCNTPSVITSHTYELKKTVGHNKHSRLLLSRPTARRLLDFTVGNMGISHHLAPAPGSPPTATTIEAALWWRRTETATTNHTSRSPPMVNLQHEGPPTTTTRNLLIRWRSKYPSQSMTVFPSPSWKTPLIDKMQTCAET